MTSRNDPTPAQFLACGLGLRMPLLTPGLKNVIGMTMNTQQIQQWLRYGCPDERKEKTFILSFQDQTLAMDLAGVDPRPANKDYYHLLVQTEDATYETFSVAGRPQLEVRPSPPGFRFPPFRAPAPSSSSGLPPDFCFGYEASKAVRAQANSRALVTIARHSDAGQGRGATGPKRQQHVGQLKPSVAYYITRVSARAIVFREEGASIPTILTIYHSCPVEALDGMDASELRAKISKVVVTVCAPLENVTNCVVRNVEKYTRILGADTQARQAGYAGHSAQAAQGAQVAQAAQTLHSAQFSQTLQPVQALQLMQSAQLAQPGNAAAYQYLQPVYFSRVDGRGGVSPYSLSPYGVISASTGQPIPTTASSGPMLRPSNAQDGNCSPYAGFPARGYQQGISVVAQVPAAGYEGMRQITLQPADGRGSGRLQGDHVFIYTPVYYPIGIQSTQQVAVGAIPGSPVVPVQPMPSIVSPAAAPAVPDTPAPPAGPPLPPAPLPPNISRAREADTTGGKPAQAPASKEDKDGPSPRAAPGSSAVPTDDRRKVGQGRAPGSQGRATGAPAGPRPDQRSPPRPANDQGAPEQSQDRPYRGGRFHQERSGRTRGFRERERREGSWEARDGPTVGSVAAAGSAATTRPAEKNPPPKEAPGPGTVSIVVADTQPRRSSQKQDYRPRPASGEGQQHRAPEGEPQTSTRPTVVTVSRESGHRPSPAPDGHYRPSSPRQRRQTYKTHYGGPPTVQGDSTQPRATPQTGQQQSPGQRNPRGPGDWKQPRGPAPRGRPGQDHPPNSPPKEQGGRPSVTIVMGSSAKK